ncbi:MAG: potassium/chloride transporter 4/5/6, partial [Myxococcota bacterium]
MSEVSSTPEPAERQKLGTFLGVFTPTILTILGVIMYLKLGWVVGTAGLFGALGIVVFSHLITLVTSLSLSALATNMRVGVGGAYYLISRTLGLEVGGAIGIPLYLSQALSVTLYCYGLAVVLFGWWDNAPIPLIAAALVVIVGLVAAKSTQLTLKLQLPMLGLIVASIVSLLLGV